MAQLEITLQWPAASQRSGADTMRRLAYSMRLERMNQYFLRAYQPHNPEARANRGLVSLMRRPE